MGNSRSYQYIESDLLKPFDKSTRNMYIINANDDLLLNSDLIIEDRLCYTNLKKYFMQPLKESSKLNSFSINTIDNIIASLPIIHHIIKRIKVNKINKLNKIKILEVACGNGEYASKISNFEEVGQYIATDIMYYLPKYKIDIIPADAAIRKYYNFDVLIIISPPPNSLVDYHAVREYENTKIKTKKNIILLGSIGDGDSTKFMYHYLFKASAWECILGLPYYKYSDVITDVNDEGPVVKYIYWFVLQKNV